MTRITTHIFRAALALAFSGGLLAAELPEDVTAEFGRISIYDGATGTLTLPCMAFYDGDDNVELDLEGIPRVFSATLRALPNRQFQLLTSTRLDAAAVAECSGAYQDDVYRDLVHMQNAGPLNSGKVLSVTMDRLQADAFTLMLREDLTVVHDPYLIGVELTHRFITQLQELDIAGLQDFLSEAFILQRANGTYHLKDDYLLNLPVIGEFTISDVVVLQSRNTLIVRWQIAIQQVIEGVPFSGTPAPRLSTFIYENGAWRMASHANFNTPAAEN